MELGYCYDCDATHRTDYRSRRPGEVCCPRTVDRQQRCGRPAAGPLCDPCTAAVREAVRGLPEAYVNLYVALSPARRGLPERRSVGFESQVPLAVPVSDLMAKIGGRVGDPGVVLTWDQVVRAELRMAGATYAPHPDPLRPGTGPALVESCRFLDRHLPDLLRVDASAGEELLGLYAEAQRLLGLADGDDFEHLRDPQCPTCRTRTLMRRFGSDVIACGRCGNEWAGIGVVMTEAGA